MFKYLEFLQDKNGKLSLGSLTTLGTWIVASGLLIWHFSESMFLEYIGAFITHRLGSKYLDKAIDARSVVTK